MLFRSRFALGAPPTTTLHTGGTLNAMVPPLTGKLGEVKYAPLAPSLTYRFLTDGPVRPYLGGGLNHMRVLSTSDADVSDFRVKHASGLLVQAGKSRCWPVWSFARSELISTAGLNCFWPEYCNSFTDPRSDRFTISFVSSRALVAEIGRAHV